MLNTATRRQTARRMWQFGLLRHQYFVRYFSTPAETPAGHIRQFWKLIGAAMTMTGAGVTFVTLYPSLKEMFKDATDLVPHAIDKSKVVVSPEEVKNFVSRPMLEETLRAAFDAAPKGAYTVIYGAKGVGKSAVMKHVAAGRPAVVKLLVQTMQFPESIVSQIVLKVTGKTEEGYDTDKLIEAIERCKVVPTIIFDVERGEDVEQMKGLGNVRSVCKSLAHRCRCFIVLSEANAVTQFGNDPDRENFVFVDEMSADEAKKLLEMRLESKSMSEETMSHIFKTIGTNAAKLEKLASHVACGHSVDDFVNSTLKKTKVKFGGFPFKSILKALKEHPDGVSRVHFEGIVEKGVELGDKSDVMKVSKKHNVILYHDELDQYQLVSTAHKTALKTYDIPEQKPWYYWKK